MHFIPFARHSTDAMPTFAPSTSDAAGCLTELERISPGMRALGLCSVVVGALMGVPQCVKIHRRRSARGVSHVTLALGNVGAFLCALNLYVLHYDQIVLASEIEGVSGWFSAQSSLVFLWVELATAASTTAATAYAYAYAEDTESAFVWSVGGISMDWSMEKAIRIGAMVQACAVVGAWTPAVVALRGAGECAPVARYGNAMGVVVAIITCFKFMPQVVSSMENKGSGSLSYVTYGVDCCAGVVALLQKLFVTKERVSTWVPPLLLHSMEAYVLGMNYFYDRMKMREARERRERDSEAGGEYGSDDERAQSERLIARANRSGDPASPRASSPPIATSEKRSWSQILDVFL